MIGWHLISYTTVIKIELKNNNLQGVHVISRDLEISKWDNFKNSIEKSQNSL
jgi:hypothetical protein